MAEFVKATEMPQYRDLLQELLDLEDGLRDWEVEFIDSLSNWKSTFTKKQAATLEKIYERVF